MTSRMRADGSGRIIGLSVMTRSSPSPRSTRFDSPGRKKDTWLDYKQWEISLDGERRVITPEKLVFKAPRLSSSDVKAIKASYRRLRGQPEPRDMRKVETLLGQVFLWALQNPGEGVDALKGFGATFHTDGALGESESTYREMYKEITGRPLGVGR